MFILWGFFLCFFFLAGGGVLIFFQCSQLFLMQELVFSGSGYMTDGGED